MRLLTLVLLILSFFSLLFNVYLAFFFKRPAITEEKEIVRIEEVIPQKTYQTGTLDLGKHTINLVNEKEEGIQRFVQTTVIVEYMTTDLTEMEKEKAGLADLFIKEISFRKIKDLDTLNAKIDLKSTLIAQFNKRLKHSIVKDVYFEAFTIQ